MRVAIAFNKLVNAVQPTSISIEKGRLHASTIKARLSSSFTVSKSIFIGSTSRDTAIRSTSDVDLLVVLKRDEARWGGNLVNSNTIVNRVRNDLSARFRATTVRRDGQAIVIQFGQGSEPVDVVPAIFHEFRGSARAPVYLIPRGDGAWMETAPEAHQRYLVQKNNQSSGKLRRTIKLLKHWRASRADSIPLSSIHLELLLASESVCVGAKSYSTCIAEAFDSLRRRECRGLRDPVGVAGVLYAVNTQAQHDRLRSAIEYAADHANRAVHAEVRKDWSEALRQWNIVFNGAFPA